MVTVCGLAQQRNATFEVLKVGLPTADTTHSPALKETVR